MIAGYRTCFTHHGDIRHLWINVVVIKIKDDRRTGNQNNIGFAVTKLLRSSAEITVLLMWVGEALIFYGLYIEQDRIGLTHRFKAKAIDL